MTTGKQILARNHQIRLQRKDAFKAFVTLAETINNKRASQMDDIHRYELYAHAARFVGYGKAEKYMAEKAVKTAYRYVDCLLREAPHVGPVQKFDLQVYSDFGGVIYRNAVAISQEFRVDVSTFGYRLTRGNFNRNEDVFFHYAANDSLHDNVSNGHFFYPLERVILPGQYDLVRHSMVLM
ncbi:MAG: hypothetical protein M1530_00800 [Candidatus Marsarchaeota archaeon]|nr:hypothetical protein [Candidatus Marsarchaeota archaeon]